jgi:hypothetical protein
MSSFDECRRQWALEVTRRGRTDLIVWVVPCYDPLPDDTRQTLVLRSHDDPVMTIPKQQRDALRFLTRLGGVVPRPLLVVVWYERCRIQEVWGIVSTGRQLRHPTVIFRNECRMFPPPESLILAKSELPWTWSHLLELRSPELPLDDRDLPAAIRFKGRIIHKLQLRDPLTKDDIHALDGGFLDLESSRILICRDVMTLRQEMKLLDERFMGSLRHLVPQFVQDAALSDHLSIFHHAVLPLVGQRKLNPHHGQVALDASVAIQVLVELWRQEHQLGQPSYTGLEDAITHAAWTIRKS